jgi:hypothetical protein
MSVVSSEAYYNSRTRFGRRDILDCPSIAPCPARNRPRRESALEYFRLLGGILRHPARDRLR